MTSKKLPLGRRVAPRSDGEPKRIVYLFGAGSTQAEVQYLGQQAINILMADGKAGSGLSTGVLKRAGEKMRKRFSAEHAIDIEKVISLLAGTGLEKDTRAAARMRVFYFEEMRARLVRSGVLNRPRLAIVLLEMHADATFRRVERLSGILTTNHDGLLQVASNAVYRGLNLGFPFSSDIFEPSPSAPPVVQLHGSFTWRYSLPIRVGALPSRADYSADTAWIPPSTLKESKSYPFNKLASLAYELLTGQCDVLRIVGASLAQNDWNVLSLVFNAQAHRALLNGAPFRVELIMSEKSGDRIKKDCSFLSNVFSIGYLSDGDFSGYKEQRTSAEMQNAFGFWLRQKIEHHHRNGQLGTPGRMSEFARFVGGPE